MPFSATLPSRRRAVPLYAVLCALTGLSGLTLSLTAHPDGIVHHLEQMAAEDSADEAGRTALVLHEGDPAHTL